MARTPVGAVVVLVAAPAVYAAARGEHDLSFPVSLAAVLGAASLAFAIDDPAESSLSPCPVARSSRRWIRAVLIAVAVAASWLVVAGAASAADYALGSLRTRCAETVAAGAVSVAFAARAARDGSDSPGLAAVTATLLAFGASSGLAIALTWLPQMGNPTHTTRWWIVAAAATTAAWWCSRDPAARIPLRSSIRSS